MLAEIDWNHLLQKPDTLPIMIVTGFAGIIALAAVIAPQIRRARQASEEARLKERMIERGFTADEIETVITASAEPKRLGKAARFSPSGLEASCGNRHSQAPGT